MPLRPLLHNAFQSLMKIRSSSLPFCQIIRRHFYLKKAAIIKQCEQWVSQVKDHSSKKKSVAVHYEAMKRHFATLKVELDKLTQEQLTSDSPSPHLPQPPPYSNPDSFAPEKENVVYL